MALVSLLRRQLIRFRNYFLGAAVIVSLVLAAVLYYISMPISVNAAWQYTEVARDLPNISAVQTDSNGDMYALLEDKMGQGYLLMLHNEIRKHVLDGLDKPDGMVAEGNDFIISEETSNGRLIRFTPSSQQSSTLAKLQSAEGIAVESNGDFLVVEDRMPGRLVRVTKNGNVDILLKDLHKAEGVCTSKLGNIYIAEKASGRILALKNGKKSILIEGLNKPGVVNCGLSNDLWITEDRRNTGRLIHFENNQLTTIAGHLHNPQGISFDPSGRLLLAEQGTGRILAFTRKN
jgi:sugar lactone lactonase YvrE